MKPEKFEEEFNGAIAEWRSKNGVEEKDAVVLLLDLFRIHQKHWDAIRHQEMPDFTEYQQSILKLGEAVKEYRALSEGLLREFQGFKSFKQTFWMLCWPVGSVTILGVIFGIFIGHFWL